MQNYCEFFIWPQFFYCLDSICGLKLNQALTSESFTPLNRNKTFKTRYFIRKHSLNHI